MDPMDIYHDSSEDIDENEYLPMCHLQHETAKGLLVVQQTPEGTREAWFPKSYSEFISEDEFEYASWITPDWVHRPRVATLFPETDLDDEDVL